MYGNNTFRRFLKARMENKYSLISILIIIMLVLGSNFFCIIAIGENPDTSTNFFIESRFKLWDNNEKMLDETFTIHLIYYNNSNNNTFSYYIQINNEIYSNTSQYYKAIDIVMKNNDIITIFIIKINNETIFEENNIRIVGGVSSGGISRSIDDYTISLSPFQWTNKERNIVFSVIVSGIISIVFGFRLVKFYRSKNGIKIIKD